MNNVGIKIGRLAYSQIQPSSSIIFPKLRFNSPNSYGGVRFIQATNNNSDPKQTASSNKMADKSSSNNPSHHKNLNVMEEAFGEGYSTRSDEEGFGGVYGGNDETNTEQKVINDPAHHDSTQGSHVAEKEKARNQKHVD